MFLAHLILAAYATATRGPGEFHWAHEPPLVYWLVLLDLPVLILSSLIAFLATYVGSPLHTSWLAQLLASVFVILCVSMQWFLVGYGVEQLVKHVLRVGKRDYVRRDI